jgi:hypothetical protein
VPDAGVIGPVFPRVCWLGVRSILASALGVCIAWLIGVSPKRVLDIKPLLLIGIFSPPARGVSVYWSAKIFYASRITVFGAFGVLMTLRLPSRYE